MSLYPAQESKDPSFPQNAAEAAVGAGSDADPRELAKHDTLAALLHMQVGGPAIRYIPSLKLLPSPVCSKRPVNCAHLCVNNTLPSMLCTPTPVPLKHSEGAF